MNNIEYNDEKLNMFIDEQLDTDEMNCIREAILDDTALRERVCQLKAVRELVGFAYQSVPRSCWDRRNQKPGYSALWKSAAASLILGFGVLLGWQASGYSNATGTAATAFSFYANQAAVDHSERKIVLHISTDDIGTVNAALNEANTLLASYEANHTPLKIDIVTNKSGINLLRMGVSPYLDRIESMVANHNVSLYACQRSIMKAEKKEGTKVILMPDAVTTRAARDIIPERLEQGWVYIKV